MSLPTDGHPEVCPPDEIIEQYVLSAVRVGDEPVPAPALEAHFAACEKCRERFEVIGEETRLLRAVLLAAESDEGEVGVVSDEMLAQYLDDSLDTETRRAVERSLSRDRGAQARLVAVRRELGVVLGSQGAEEAWSVERVDLAEERAERESRPSESPAVDEPAAPQADEEIEEDPPAAETRKG
ncbi:MAG: hypothetical protein GWP08_03150 [Nitrospiraceae bacterium]|nr:hypothetical protein [Nitrospiraceae bacterium]